jgi:stalled ribosome alternative rescue factor ArfA
MQGIKLLHKFVKESCPTLHKKLKDSLLVCCKGLMEGKKLSITAIGKAIKSHTSVKHQIKRSDRLFSSEALLSQKDNIYLSLILKVLPADGFLPVLVDTCFITPDCEFQMLRGSIAMSGRALTLYEIVYRNGELSFTMEVFLKKLKELLPENIHAVFITDAGFHNRWFKLVKKYGWDFIGRVRQNKIFKTRSGELKYCNSLHKTAKAKPKCEGEIMLCKSNSIACNLYTIKRKILGRKKKNKKGGMAKGSYSRIHAKSQREPWVLASSLPATKFNAKAIVHLYSLRMQIEESFRDMKNSRSGFSLKQTLTRCLKRLNTLMLVAAIVSFIVWLIGKTAENNNWQRHFQSNTSKRRVVSHFYLGLMIISSNLIRMKLENFAKELDKIKKHNPAWLGYKF